MSLLEHKEIATEVAVDPIVDYADHGLPIRTLVEHGVFALDWLATNATLPLHIVSRDASGELATKTVYGVDLLLHGYAAGWKPIQSEKDFPLPCFEDLLTWLPDEGEQAGVWFAPGDCLDDATAVPLTLPDTVAKHRRRVRQARRQYQRKSLADAKNKVVLALWNPGESKEQAVERAEVLTEHWRGNPRQRLYVDAASLASGHAQRGGRATFWQIFQVLRRKGEDGAYELMRRTELAS